jgi:hypothetical protein
VRERAIGSDELEQLRRWGEGLRGDPREEVAAAGRAIVLLVEEVERLTLNAWNERLYGPPLDESTPDVPTSLLHRLRSRRRREGEDPQHELG